MRFFIGILVAALALAATPIALSAKDGRPDAGKVIGRIIIPAIGVNLSIVEGGKDGREDGYYPTHYRSTDWCGEGQTVAISGHHATHWLPGATGGAFLRIGELHRGAVIRVRMGANTCSYRVTGQRVIPCAGQYRTCQRAVQGFRAMGQNKLVLTTCEDYGAARRFVYAFPTQEGK